MNHKKHGTLFLTITTTFLGQFFTLFAASETGINTLQWNYTFSKFTLAVSIHYLVKPSVSMKRQIQHETSNFGVSHHNVLLFATVFNLRVFCDVYSLEICLVDKCVCGFPFRTLSKFIDCGNIICRSR